MVLEESGWAALARIWEGGVVLCMCVLHPVFIPVAPYRYRLPNLYLSVADNANPDLFACDSRTWISCCCCSP